MAKKTLELDGLLKSESPQGETREAHREVAPPKKRPAESESPLPSMARPIDGCGFTRPTRT